MRYRTRDRFHLDLEHVPTLPTHAQPATRPAYVNAPAAHTRAARLHETRATRHATRQLLHEVEKGADPEELAAKIA